MFNFYTVNAKFDFTDTDMPELRLSIAANTDFKTNGLVIYNLKNELIVTTNGGTSGDS